MKKKPHAPERTLIKACLLILRQSGIFAWRNNTGALRDTKNRPVYFGLAGSADILGIMPPNGQMIAVETKVGANKPTPAQEAFLDEIKACGGLAIVVRQPEELVEALAVSRSARLGMEQSQ